MLLHFPNLDVLRLALTSGTVPPEVSRAGVQATFGEQGEVWVDASVALPRACHAPLRALGVRGCRVAPAALDVTACCWPQLLPIQTDRAAPATGDNVPVLFDLPDAAQLSSFVAEMLRLGNDRQSFRCLSDGANTRALLRVVGPPYYTLLRALERDGQPDAARAFVERHPRVWVEIGFTHPLERILQPPAGKLLLLAPPREWTMLDEAPFHDVYEIVDLKLPKAPCAWQDAGLPQRIAVPLQLSRGGSADVAELWVLSEAAVEQMDALAQGADQRLVSQLAFAVAEREGSPVVVLRVRPGKGAPPALVFDGLSCRPWMKLPNLFIPCGTRLHPPLRRDAITALLAGDQNQITWLQPLEEGSFVPWSIPDAAFRPLEDWVDYILDHEHQPLEAWIEAARFEFEPFVCDEAVPPKPAPQARRTPATDSPEKEKKVEPAEPAPGLMKRMLKKLVPESPKAPAEQETPQPAVVTSAEAQRQRLRNLEARFLELPAPLDSAERRELWREMGRLNSALHYGSDAATCWRNAVWDEPSPPAGWLRAWFQAESGEERQPLSVEELDAILTDPAPGSSLLNSLAAHLYWMAHSTQVPAASPDGLEQRLPPGSTAGSDSGRATRPVEELAARLGHIQQLLEKQESALPVRTAWLAWLAVGRLSRGDCLAVARARDRLLERLLQHGLSADLDLPAFLRAAGLRGGDRCRMVRGRLFRLREHVQRWSAEQRGLSAKWTREYIDFLFAFGLARLAEVEQARELMDRASLELPGSDAVHHWLTRAYRHRIEKVLDGKPGPPPDDLASDLERMPRETRYKVDRLREHSRILEPHEKVKPYARWQRFGDQLSQDLVELFDLHDRAKLAHRIRALLEPQAALPPPRRARVYAVALELAPRLGEAFAQELLPDVVPLLDQLTDVVQQALLLERGLFLAAHYDQPLAVQSFVGRFQQLLETDHDLETLKALEPVLHQSFKGLRKLGMRDEIAWLLEKMANAVRRVDGAGAPGAGGTSPPGRAAASRAEALKLLLQVAAGWFYFGQAERAWPVLDDVRDVLFSGELKAFQQTPLACAYASALGHAAVDVAFERLEELFGRLRGISDTFTTNSHYSLSQLDVVEAAVLALVSDEFIVGEAGRRWLEDDEFLVRRRIHRDMRAMLELAKG